jgi:acyl carrier protein
MASDNIITLEAVTDRITTYLQQHLAKTQPDFAAPLHTNMSFDYMGLDSLSRVELISALSKEWSKELDLTAAYDFVTIGALSEFIWQELTQDKTKTINPEIS